MNSLWIKINNFYYNVDKIESIAFKIVENTIDNKKLYFVLINLNEIQVDEKNYNRIKEQFLECIGVNSIYE